MPVSIPHERLDRAPSLTYALLFFLDNRTFPIETLRLCAEFLFQKFKYALGASSASEEVIERLLEDHIKGIQQITDLSALHDFFKTMLLQQSMITHKKIEAQLNENKTATALSLSPLFTSEELAIHSQAIRTLFDAINHEMLHIGKLFEMAFINDRVRGLFLNTPAQSSRFPFSKKERIDSDLIYCLQSAINCTDEALREISFIVPVILSVIEMAHAEKINTKTYLDVLLENTQLCKALLSFFIKFYGSNPQDVDGMLADSAALRHCFVFFAIHHSVPQWMRLASASDYLKVRFQAFTSAFTHKKLRSSEAFASSQVSTTYSLNRENGFFEGSEESGISQINGKKKKGNGNLDAFRYPL